MLARLSLDHEKPLDRGERLGSGRPHHLDCSRAYVGLSWVWKPRDRNCAVPPQSAPESSGARKKAGYARPPALRIFANHHFALNYCTISHTKDDASLASAD